MPQLRRGRNRVWTARAKRVVAAISFLLLVLGISTQSATAQQLTPGRLPLGAVAHFLKDLTVSSPKAPAETFGRGVKVSSTRVGVGSGHAPGVGIGQQSATAVRGKNGAGLSAKVQTGFNAKTSVFMPSKSTAYESWWKNTDGSLTEKISSAPANYRTAQGTWEPIDTSLTQGADGAWQQKANSFGLTLDPSTGSAAVPALSVHSSAVATSTSAAAGSRLGTMTFGSGESFSWGLAGTASVTATQSDGTLTYPGILPDTTLKQASESWGTQQTLVLSSAAAADSWTFPITMAGLSIAQSSSGTWELKSSAGTVVATLPAPYAYDAKGAHTDAVDYSLATVDGVQELTLSLAASWLHSSARAFPVSVDPTISDPGSETSAQVSYLNPSTNYGTTDTLGVGQVLNTAANAYDTQRSFITYPSTDIADTGYHVTAAGWTGFMTSGSTSDADSFSVYSVATPWSASTIDASNAPTSYIANLGTYSGDVVDSATCGTISGNWVGVTLNAADMSQFELDEYSWSGLMLMANSESSTAYYRQFDSSEVSSCSSYLDLTYTADEEPTLATMDPATGTAVSSLTPQLTATGSDPDSWPDASVEFEFYLFSVPSSSTETSAPLIAKSPLTTTGSWTIPADTLKWNNTYEWQVCVWDGWECQSPASDLTTYTFATIAPAPMLTQDLSQSTDGHGFDAQSGDYTDSVTDADVAGIGPSLSIVRDYNSLDNRTGESFGEGWSSMLDATVTQGLDTTGALVEAGVTYPDGSLVAFGYNSGGSYSPPEGRYATLTATTNSSGAVTSYAMTDSTGTTYTFGEELTAPVTGDGDKSVPGVFGLSAITDHQGRALNIAWGTFGLTHEVDNDGTVTSVTSSFERVGTISNPMTGRTLTMEWTWPEEILNMAGATGVTEPHVSEVLTSDATSGESSTQQAWSYTYNGNELSSMCAPSQSAPSTPSTACTGYSYNNGSVYRTAVLDGSPYQFWPLADVSSTEVNTSSSLVDANVGVGTAQYESLTADTTATPGPMTPIGSTEAGAVFDPDSDSSVILPTGMIVNTTYMSVGLWFKTGTSGPLFCEQSGPINTTPSSATCSLYVGTDGKLHGAWYQGSTATTITSTNTVDDGKWHFALLSGEGDNQTLYLDGSAQGTLSGTIANGSQTFEYVGAGYSSAAWPDTPAKGPWYFNGSIADVAVYKQGVPAAEVSSLYNAATVPTAQLTKITRPDAVANPTTENSAAKITYSTITGRVTSVTDANGGLWTVGTPSVSGSSQVFDSDVMSMEPIHYYELNDSASATAPTDQVNSDAWANEALAGDYNAVGLGSTGTVFNDGTTAATFDSADDSYVGLPNSVAATAPSTIALWFYVGATPSSGPLYCMQNESITSTSAPSAATCPLYVGTNGHLYGGFYMGTTTSIGSAHSVTSGWHYAVLSATSTSESLYLDGALVGTQTGTFDANGQTSSYIGAGYSSGDWQNSGAKGNWYFNGGISDFAMFDTALSQAQVTTLWQGYDNTVGSIVPLETVTVTDPENTAADGDGVETYAYDPAHGGREVSYTDALGGTTVYAYDDNGFLYSTTDPNGDEVITGRDARGNAVSTTTCELESQNDCQTSYATYYWSANDLLSTTGNVDADLEVTSSDGRSTSASETTYETKYAYDGNGNELTETDPDGDTTTNVYTNGTLTYPACVLNEPGTASTTQGAPAGLLAKTTTAGGAVTQYSYYPDGDTCEVVDADGLETLFTYDLLGRVLTKTVAGSPSVPVTGLVQYNESLTTTYTYDGDGRVVQTVAPAVTDRITGAVHTAVTTQAFDADGNVTCTSVADSTGGDATRTTTYTYNGDDEEASETAPEGNTAQGCSTVTPDELDGQNHTTTYTYDQFGNVASEIDPQGRETDYLYDADNRLVTTEEAHTTTSGTYSSTALPLITEALTRAAAQADLLCAT